MYLNELSNLQNRSMKLTYGALKKYDTYDVKKGKILDSEKLNEDELATLDHFYIVARLFKWRNATIFFDRTRPCVVGSQRQTP